MVNEEEKDLDEEEEGQSLSVVLRYPSRPTPQVSSCADLHPSEIHVP